VRVLPGEAISVGSLVLMVQPNRPPLSARPRPLSHDEFQGRVEWECARAEATGGTFSVARVLGPIGASVNGGALRPIDVIGCYAPGEYELLMPGIVGETASSLARAFARPLSGSVDVGVASYPDDGRHASALLARAAASTRNHAPSDATGPIASVEENMQRVEALAERAAAGDINVLVLGETGVGKEVLVSQIHAASPRAARPMVAINCAALVPSLAESELFGHERGAFTGAGQAKEGLLESAAGGTVFLDEIGELPLSLQGKLLRVLETREVLRVGGVRPRKIDVRFIAATNRDLEAEVSQGSFRADLYFRLNGMTLTIPPLRERPRDIPLLANAFLERAVFIPSSARNNIRRISEPAMAALLAYAWPGNVRELRLVIERALIVGSGSELLPDDLPRRPPVVPDVEPAALPPATPRAAADDERARILAALAACGGNQSRAARQLGISRKVLMARLDRYGVARPKKPGPA